MKRILVASLLTAMASSALAGPTIPKPSQLPDVPIKPGVLIFVGGGSVAHTTGAHGVVVSAPSAPLGNAAALASFKLSFDNGDHKIRILQVTSGRDGAMFAINDQNTDDSFTADARWITLGGLTSLEVNGEFAGGSGSFRIPPGPADTTFVLQGFKVERTPRSDANVRELAVVFNPTTSSVGVNFRDDMHGGIAASGGRTVRVTVQYIWVPNWIIASSGTVTGSESARDAAEIPGKVMAGLRGFRFAFSNSDHYLKVVGADTASGGSANFQDNNLDDAMRWTLEFVTFKRSSACSNRARCADGRPDVSTTPWGEAERPDSH